VRCLTPCVSSSPSPGNALPHPMCVEYIPFGTGPVIGVRRAGRRRAPDSDGYGPGTRTDGLERLRRPSHPPGFPRGTKARGGGSSHVRHHPLMGTTETKRRGLVESLISVIVE
jgi:hypothetical protein